MVITEYEHWLVVRQSRRRRIYRVTLVATVSRTLRTPLGARARKRGGFMQLRWFHIRGVCIAPGCVYRSSSAKRGMGIPGDHVNRVETYHHPLELAVVRELQSRVRLPTDEGTVQS